MATNDKFIQSIVELLDKLIDHQSRNASLLTEIKSSLFELRSEASEILLNLREKLPETLSHDQDDLYRKLNNTTIRIEDNNLRVYDNIKIFEQNYQNIKSILDKNNQVIDSNNKVLNDIYLSILEKQEEKKKLESTVNEVNQFISGLKSKKTWAALIVAGIAALATVISTVVEGINSFKNETKATSSQPIVTPHKP